MIRSFRDQGTLDLFEGRDSKKARRKLAVELWARATAKLDALDAATRLQQLSTPSNRLHALKGDRQGQHSIRINDQYRICFVWDDGDAWDVEVTDYH